MTVSIPATLATWILASYGVVRSGGNPMPLAAIAIGPCSNEFSVKASLYFLVAICCGAGRRPRNNDDDDGNGPASC